MIRNKDSVIGTLLKGNFTLYDLKQRSEEGVNTGGTRVWRKPMLSCTCWCEETIVTIPQNCVGKLTLSCGRVGCAEPSTTVAA